MSLPEFSVKKPIATLMVMLSVLVLGVLAWQRLPLMLFPDLSWPNLSINIPYRSSSPQEVEELITIPVEDAMGTLSHLQSISSTSSSNGAYIRLEFQWGTDMDMASVEVRDRLDRVRSELPSDVERVFIRRFQTTDMPVLQFAIAWTGSKDELYDIVEKTLVPHLQRIDGVANVDVGGMDVKQVLVELDQERLHAHRLDALMVARAIRTNNQNLSAGWVMDGGRKFTLRSIGEFRSLNDLRNLPLVGNQILLKDVADVRYDFPRKERYQRLNRHDAVTITVYKASTANVVDVARRVKAELESIRRSPGMEGLSYQIFRDQSRDILRGIRSLLKAGLYGGLLAAAVLYFFLRKFRSTVIVVSAVPISIVFTSFFMYLIRKPPFNSEITINIVSLSGLMFAVGMLVDPAVVVVENIFRHKQEEGLGPVRAAIVGASEVGTAVWAASLTTVIVFLPLVFLQQTGMGRWMNDFGVAITTATIASMLVALTLVPLLASKLFVGKERPKAKSITLLTNGYVRLVRWTLRNRGVTFGSALLLFAGSVYLFTHIERDYTPNVPERMMRIRVIMPKSYSIDDAKRLFFAIEDTLLGQKEKLEIETLSVSFSDRRGDIAIFFTPPEQAKRSTYALYQLVRSKLPQVPGVEYHIRRMHSATGETGINIDLHGPSLEVLQLLAEEVKARLAGIPDLKDLDTSMERGEPQVQIAVQRDKAQKYGLSTTQIASTIFSALSDRSSSKFKTRDREVDINVHLREEDRVNIQQLKNMPVRKAAREAGVTLGSVAAFRLARGPESIQRDERKNVLSVTANVERRGLSSASQAVMMALSDLRLPPGYDWSFGRRFRMWRREEQSSWFAIGLAVLLVWMVMAALFESFLHPFTILMSVPFAFIGVAFLFWVSHTRLDMMGRLGMMVAAGLVVNNGIILVDHINQLRREKGMNLFDAVVLGSQHRLRPILMTTLTTIIGLTPMIMPKLLPSVFGPPEGRSSYYAAVGLSVVGGLTMSTFLTLIVMPTVYLAVDDFANWARRVLALAGRRADSPEPPVRTGADGGKSNA
ncbi:MAG TPA: efflux RND transporter permease subunit [Bacteroidetes bacterium]|nr:efflux RND transporter permease subunit [Bacteroidota bacterium]